MLVSVMIVLPIPIPTQSIDRQRVPWSYIGVRAYLKIENYFKWITGLTGTPASNNYIDTHGQFLICS
jgi:hypothetical protein